MDKYLPVSESEQMIEYARLAIERHALLRDMPEEVEEEGGTEALWRVEDKMAIGWQRLDEAQRQAVSGLTSDLASVRRKGALAPKSHALADVSSLHVKMLLRALNDFHVYEALHYARVCRPLTGRHLSAAWRASLYSEAFRGVASEVFSKAAGEIFPRFANPFELPTPIGWADFFRRFPERWGLFPPPYRIEMWEEMMQRPEARFPFDDEALKQPLIANRIAALMLETMPWPLSMVYLLAAVSQTAESVADTPE